MKGLSKGLKLMLAVGLLTLSQGCARYKVTKPICPSLPSAPPVLMEKVQRPSYFPNPSS